KASGIQHLILTRCRYSVGKVSSTSDASYQQNSFTAAQIKRESRRVAPTVTAISFCSIMTTMSELESPASSQMSSAETKTSKQMQGKAEKQDKNANPEDENKLT